MMTNELIKAALLEDIGCGDITTDSIIKFEKNTTAKLISKESGIIAGINIFKRVFIMLDPHIECKLLKIDGTPCAANEICAVIKGDCASILKGERVALNFLQHLSGIATLTAQFVSIARKYGVMIADTRKTLPGLRELHKYAVKAGGGVNHRIGLYDHILIKDNHIKAVGGITAAVAAARQNAGFIRKIEVETTTIAEVNEALENKVDIIMLDNFSIEKIIEAKKIINGRAIIELSGNITLDNLVKYCECRPDVISAGCLTHSVKAIDFSLNLE